MRIRLVFDDWRNRRNESVYQECYELTLGDFHHGTIFDAEIELALDDETELKQRIHEGFIPVFYVVP